MTPITVNGIRGFDAELVITAGKVSYRLGDYSTLGAGFVPAEIPVDRRTPAGG